MSDPYQAFKDQYGEIAPRYQGGVHRLLFNLLLVLVVLTALIFGIIFIVGDGPIVVGAVMMIGSLVCISVVGPAFLFELRDLKPYEKLVLMNLSRQSVENKKEIPARPTRQASRRRLISLRHATRRRPVRRG